MSETHIVDRNRVLRVVDSEDYVTANYTAGGLIDRDTTDYLEVIGNADDTDPGIQIAAKNDAQTDVDIELNPKGAGTLTIGGTGGVTVTSGNLTLSSGTVATGNLSGGTVETVIGLSGVTTGTGPWFQTVLTLSSVGVAITDADDGNGAGGGTKLFTFPEGHIKIAGAHYTSGVDGVAADSTDVAAADATYDIGLGSTVGIGPELATTEQDILTKIEGDLASSLATVASADSTDLTLDGSTTAAACFINIAIEEADSTAGTDNVAFSGTVTLTWANLGDD